MFLLIHRRKYIYILSHNKLFKFIEYNFFTKNFYSIELLIINSIINVKLFIMYPSKDKRKNK